MSISNHQEKRTKRAKAMLGKERQANKDQPGDPIPKPQSVLSSRVRPVLSDVPIFHIVALYSSYIWG